METLHTKGEWFAKEGQIYPIETGKTLALIPYFDKEDKEQEANAKLIAAAPDLLEAASNVVTILEAISFLVGNGVLKDKIIMLNKAIEKATE
jgi:hypothetical protein